MQAGTQVTTALTALAGQASNLLIYHAPDGMGEDVIHSLGHLAALIKDSCVNLGELLKPSRVYMLILPVPASVCTGEKLHSVGEQFKSLQHLLSHLAGMKLPGITLPECEDSEMYMLAGAVIEGSHHSQRRNLLVLTEQQVRTAN